MAAPLPPGVHELEAPAPNAIAMLPIPLRPPLPAPLPAAGFFQPRQLLHSDSGSELQLHRESSSKRMESSELKRSISSGFHSLAAAPAPSRPAPPPPAPSAPAPTAAAPPPPPLLLLPPPLLLLLRAAAATAAPPPASPPPPLLLLLPLRFASVRLRLCVFTVAPFSAAPAPRLFVFAPLCSSLSLFLLSFGWMYNGSLPNRTLNLKSCKRRISLSVLLSLFVSPLLTSFCVALYMLDLLAV